MTDQEQLNDILKSISADLALDDDNECQVETDAGEECLVSLIEQTGQLVLSVPLVTTTEADRFDMFREALIVNDDLTLTGSARICFSPEQGMLMLRHATMAEGHDRASFEALLASVLELGNEMTGHLQSDDTVAGAGIEPEQPLIDSGYGPGIIVA